MPPNEPATPGTDRLFSEGSCCALCGDASIYSTHGTRTEFYYCEACRVRFGSRAKSGEPVGVEAEYLRRKSAPTPEFVPDLDAPCEGISDGTHSPAGTIHRGAFTGNSIEAPASCWIDSTYRVTRSSLKPAPAPVEFYSGQPAELPETLPAGTRFIWPKGSHRPGDISEAGSDLKLTSGKLRYEGLMIHSFGGQSQPIAQWEASCIDWASVPKSSQKAVPAQSAMAPCAHTSRDKFGNCLACGQRCTLEPEPGQSPPDPAVWGIPSKRRSATPYGPACLECGQETTRVNHAGKPSCVDCQCMVADEILGKGLANEPIDRRIASARQSTEREAGVKSHPESWPEGAGEELYVL